MTPLYKINESLAIELESIKALKLESDGLWVKFQEDEYFVLLVKGEQIGKQALDTIMKAIDALIEAKMQARIRDLTDPHKLWTRKPK